MSLFQHGSGPDKASDGLLFLGDHELLFWR